MADDIAEMQKEMSQLRHDLARVWELLRSEELRLSQLEAGIISVRHGREKPPIVLQAQPGEGAIVFNDAEGRPRGVFQVDEDGAHFEIWNKQGQVVVAIGENKESAGEIYVAGADGKPRAGLKVTHAGGVVSAQNPEAHINALMIGKADGGTIVVADADGHPLVEIAATEGRGTVSIKHLDGAQAAALTSDKNGGVLAVFDNEGRPRQQSTGNVFLP